MEIEGQVGGDGGVERRGAGGWRCGGGYRRAGGWRWGVEIGGSWVEMRGGDRG